MIIKVFLGPPVILELLLHSLKLILQFINILLFFIFYNILSASVVTPHCLGYIRQMFTLTVWKKIQSNVFIYRIKIVTFEIFSILVKKIWTN